MNFARFIKEVAIMASLVACAAPAWAAEPTAKNAQEIVGEEAVVSKVDRDQITLQSATQQGKECTLPMPDTKDLKVGDKVKVEGNAVMKVESMRGQSVEKP